MMAGGRTRTVAVAGAKAVPAIFPGLALSMALPAGRTVDLKPGGYHVMMMDLKQQMKDGDVVPVTLVVESGGKRETIEVKAKVRAATASGDMLKKDGK